MLMSKILLECLLIVEIQENKDWNVREDSVWCGSKRFVEIQENKDWNFMLLQSSAVTAPQVEIQENKDWNEESVHWTVSYVMCWNPRKQGLKCISAVRSSPSISAVEIQENKDWNSPPKSKKLKRGELKSKKTRIEMHSSMAQCAYADALKSKKTRIEIRAF